MLSWTDEVSIYGVINIIFCISRKLGNINAELINADLPLKRIRVGIGCEN